MVIKLQIVHIISGVRKRCQRGARHQRIGLSTLATLRLGVSVPLAGTPCTRTSGQVRRVLDHAYNPTYRKQSGLFSSHFTRRILHVLQPVLTFLWVFRGDLAASVFALARIRPSPKSRLGKMNIGQMSTAWCCRWRGEAGCGTRLGRRGAEGHLPGTKRARPYQQVHSGVAVPLLSNVTQFTSEEMRHTSMRSLEYTI